MSNFDFIPENKQKDESRIELVCKAFLNTPRSVYDGRNFYAPKSGVCIRNGKYLFSNDKEGLLFYPTTEEIRSALEIFKEKGYHPYYDNEVCCYGYVKDRSEIRGEAAVRHTCWL